MKPNKTEFPFLTKRSNIGESVGKYERKALLKQEI